MRLEAALRERRDAGRKLLVPYVTGGLIDGWTDVVLAFAHAGADAIEVGIPFSDPAMDGPTIQAASQASLTRGTTPMSILSELRGLDCDVPLVVMTYCNVVFRMGARRFAAELVAAGVDGTILADVPMEELATWGPAAADAGIENVLLASPLTPDDRLARLCATSRGFVYGVNLLGVTGERASLSASSAVLAKRLKAATDKPVLMGFGVATPAQAVEAAAAADGVVVASVLMRILLDGGSPEAAAAHVRTLRDALDRSS
ncbi:MAG: tryptophan synthase subunit alpha [Acidimicrobiales bacterium]